MQTGDFYRGGPRLTARTDEVRIDQATNTLKNTRGLSVYDRPDHPNLRLFGGPYLLGEIPEQLQLIRAGRDPSHYELVPVQSMSMTFDEYQALLDQIPLTPIEPPHEGA